MMEEVDEIQEVWVDIPGFPNYQISNLGRVFNLRTARLMATSKTNHGHAKVSLVSDGERYTRSVAVLTAEAFVPVPNGLCDRVIFLDGDLENVAFWNLAWRPQWFAWKYVRQLKEPQPIHYQNLPVEELDSGIVYESIVEAGMTLGLLYEDIWRSTYTGDKIFPDGHLFEVIQRV